MYCQKKQRRSGGVRGRMISEADRKNAVELIDEAVENGEKQENVCLILGIFPRTYKRWVDLHKKQTPMTIYVPQQREIVPLLSIEKKF